MAGAGAGSVSRFSREQERPAVSISSRESDLNVSSVRFIMSIFTRTYRCRFSGENRLKIEQTVFADKPENKQPRSLLNGVAGISAERIRIALLLGRNRTTQCAGDFDAGYRVRCIFQHLDVLDGNLTNPNRLTQVKC